MRKLVAVLIISLSSTMTLGQETGDIEEPVKTPVQETVATEEPVKADPNAVIQEIQRSEELVLSGRGGYDYDPAGRRDPFIDPLSARESEPGGAPRPDGWPGMLIGEVQLQGLTVYGDDPIAIFRGTDSVGYFAREGDELWDGKIIAIDFEEQKIVFQQKVEDPSSPVRYREVVKKLNP